MFRSKQLLKCKPRRENYCSRCGPRARNLLNASLWMLQYHYVFNIDHETRAQVVASIRHDGIVPRHACKTVPNRRTRATRNATFLHQLANVVVTTTLRRPDRTTRPVHFSLRSFPRATLWHWPFSVRPMDFCPSGFSKIIYRLGEIRDKRPLLLINHSDEIRV